MTVTLEVITNTGLKYDVNFSGTYDEQKILAESYVSKSKEIPERIDWKYSISEVLEQNY